MSIAQLPEPPTSVTESTDHQQVDKLVFPGHYSTARSISRKRKHTESVHDTHIGEQFLIYADETLSDSKPQELAPKLLIPRSCIPLFCLDQSTASVTNPNSRLFSTRIDILEEEAHGNQRGLRILIALSVHDNLLYTIERVQPEIYVLCKLGSWVTLELLQRMEYQPWPPNLPQKQHIVELSGDLEGEWWRSAAVEPNERFWKKPSTPIQAGEVGGRLNLQRPATPSHAMCQTANVHSTPIVPMESEDLLGDMVAQVSQQQVDILSTIKSQYQEALYTSKASLAYFAKGPLSRARVLFHHRDGNGHDQQHLAQVLRLCVLPLTTMDIKYRETLPNVVKTLPFSALSDDEGLSLIAGIGKKARKSKKVKLGKNGLYPGEESSIARWWLSRDTTDIDCDSTDAREESTKAALLEQRAREAQLQIILVLETLSLECFATDLPTTYDLSGEQVENDVNAQKIPKKSKKRQDLRTLLDLLADRLCIWQSMTIEQASASGSADRPPSQHLPPATPAIGSSDHLRQFCIDVILPFYSARLPNVVSLLCQKFGGPKQASPNRPSLGKVPSTLASLKPGTSIRRERSQRPRRTLERVLTDERCASQRPIPSLSRSATAPVLPRMKREESETSLSSIPLNRVAMHKRFSQREVDLHAASHANDTKLKKKAKVDQELQNAIAALKKPNPRMAVKELVEDAEKRAVGTRSKKPRNPTRNPFAQGIQVTATPSRNRYNNVFPNLPQLPRPSGPGEEAEPDSIPPSTISHITDSTKKGQCHTGSVNSGSRSGEVRAISTIEQTPSRGSTKISGRPSVLSTTTVSSIGSVRQSCSVSNPRSSVLIAEPSLLKLPPVWVSRIDEAPSKHASGVSSQEKQHLEQATPSKPKPRVKKLTDNSPIAVPSSSQEQEQSIYASLGWDDEIDDLA